MAHEITRLMRAFGAQAWFIEPRRAEEIVALLEFRAVHGVRAEPFRDAPPQRPAAAESTGRVRIVKLYGPILPRAEAVEDVSQAAALMTQFQAAFRQAASDAEASAIVLDIDSPGGRIDLVPEAAAMVRQARKPGRPIVAVANTYMTSAAYWIGSQADELAVTPSGIVGSIGVYTVHEDVSEMLAGLGVRMTFVNEGPRKVEASPFEPLSDEAKAHLQSVVRGHYDLFVNDVAKGRKVKASVVRADPEGSEAHFGGGRCYGAVRAVELGMADSVETLDEVIARLQRAPTGRRSNSARATTFN